MRPSAAAASCGMRPRSIRLATSEVMKTVLPARLRPVTPSRTTGSKSAPPTSPTASSIRRGEAAGQPVEIQGASSSAPQT